MRISSFTIKNFKCIDERGATLHFAPITLLFGPNNAGKSTFIHALHLAREVLCNGNFNPDVPEFCIPSLDLGGFQNFVYKHELDRVVYFEFTFSIAKQNMPTFENIISVAIPGKNYSEDIAQLTKNIKTCSVGVGIRWNYTEKQAEPSFYSVFINGDHVTTLRFTSACVETYMQKLKGLCSVFNTADNEQRLHELGAKFWAMMEKDADYYDEEQDYRDAVRELFAPYCLEPVVDFDDIDKALVTSNRVGRDVIIIATKGADQDPVTNTDQTTSTDNDKFRSKLEELRTTLKAMDEAFGVMAGYAAESAIILQDNMYLNQFITTINEQLGEDTFYADALTDWLTQEQLPFSVDKTGDVDADKLMFNIAKARNILGIQKNEPLDEFALARLAHIALAVIKATSWGAEYKKGEIELIPPNSGFIDFDNALQAVADVRVFQGEGSLTEQEALTMYFVSSLVVGPGKLLRDWLRDGLRYLGPLRHIPPRSYRAPTVVSKVWANGAATWDTLALAGQSLLAKINSWLDGENSLDIGYTVERKKLLPLDATGAVSAALRRAVQEEFFEDREIALVRDLLRQPTETRLELRNSHTNIAISPCDMGTGISQVIPVVVAACTPADNALVAVEQPELHIHPKLQVALGDLFIEAIQGDVAQNKPIFLIETHSEHLLLRLLRRVRETSELTLPDHLPPITPDMLSVLYVQPNNAGGTEVIPIPVTPDGDFGRKWPKGFFTERAEELF
jgi:hypothetical protein